MSSTLQTAIITNDLSLVLYEFLADFPTTGSENHIFYVTDTDTSYEWNTGTSAYDVLSSTATDLLFYADLDSFPVTGDSISLYVANDTDYIYTWTGSAYQYAKAVTSEALMLIEGTYVVYSSPASLPNHISKNKTYRILSDNGRTYVIGNDGNNFYLDIAMAMVYFSPLNGTSWEDILGNAVIPPLIDYSVIEGISETAILNNLKILFDADNNGKVDRALHADYLEGKTGAYYLSEIALKADQTDLDATDATVALKADKTYVDDLIDNQVADQITAVDDAKLDKSG
ncbi:MAG: hypothetical protein PHY08_14255, partial [Candidatus Cloacimonetes bacterium]|nr:hypothetical protein [Candidatus Cloacimonadota bacterium]